jgi:5-formyltetrahydrofolate cyclo-ligase
LPLVGANVPLVVVLGDGELVETLPAQPHDRRVHAALLPGGVTMFGSVI